MASKKKQDEPSFADFVKQLENNRVTPAQVAIREERKYFLIVSEGIRTEPIYFQFLASMLPKHLVETIEVNGAGNNTVNVVKKAKAIRDQRKKNTELPQFDEVWAVYDKDDFPERAYNGAIELARQEGIESAHSNQSFELWYVLHFEFLQSALHRTDYIDKLSKYLGVKYEKNKLDLVRRIHVEGNVQKALLRAHKLKSLHQEASPARSCPFTRVYILVDRLIAYIENKTPTY